MDDFFHRVMTRPVFPWPARRVDLHWHVLPSPAEARRLAEPYRELAHWPGLHPVPPEWLHLTVLHSGPQQEVSAAELDDIVAEVRDAAAGVAPFEVEFGVPAVGNVAVEATGRPGAPARRLWELTAQASAKVVAERWPVLPALYYPHVSLSYSGPDGALADRAALKVWLSDHAAEPVAVSVEKLSLVAQWHDGRSAIRWEHLLDVPLGD